MKQLLILFASSLTINLSSQNCELKPIANFDNVISWGSDDETFAIQAFQNGFSHIYVFDGESYYQITSENENYILHGLTDVKKGRVSYISQTEDDEQHGYIYDGNSTIRIEGDFVSDVQLGTNSYTYKKSVDNQSQVIHVQDGEAKVISRTIGNGSLDMSDEVIAWIGSNESNKDSVFYYKDGILKVVSDQHLNGPVYVEDDIVVWCSGFADDNLYYYADTMGKIQLSKNQPSPAPVIIRDHNVLWSEDASNGKPAIWHFDGNDITQVSPSGQLGIYPFHGQNVIGWLGDGFTLMIWDDKGVHRSGCESQIPIVFPVNEIQYVYNVFDSSIEVFTCELNDDSDNDMDGWSQLKDCDDNNENINPEAEEDPTNNIDENCDCIEVTTSVKNITQGDITIYPNPFTNHITINSNEFPYIKEVSIYDIHGRLHQKEFNKYQINTSELNSGIYVLEILLEGSAFYTKVIKE